MVICVERGADLHMAQLMPLPLTVCCFSKIQIGFTFLVLAHPGVPEKGPSSTHVSQVFFLLVSGKASGQNSGLMFKNTHFAGINVHNLQ